jgi:hypothetical protein
MISDDYVKVLNTQRSSGKPVEAGTNVRFLVFFADFNLFRTWKSVEGVRAEGGWLAVVKAL